MLKPREKVDMPVFFFIDPDCLTDRALDAVETITLSYTFFRSYSPAPGPAITPSSPPSPARAISLKSSLRPTTAATDEAVVVRSGFYGPLPDRTWTDPGPHSARTRAREESASHPFPCSLVPPTSR
jgi:hypothetical protein